MLPFVVFVMMMNVNKASTKDQDKRSWVAWLRVIVLGLVLTAVTGVVMAHPLLPTGQVQLEEGDVATEHIRAPRRLTYESDILREQAQDRAAAEVASIYTTPDPALARQQLDRAREVLDYLGSVRADSLASTARKRSWVLAVPELENLSLEMVEKLLALSNESWDRVQLETLAVIGQAMREEIREGDVASMRKRVPRLVSLDLSSEEASVATALAQAFLVPNAFLAQEATEEARQTAREEVPPALRTFEDGEIIVREGERVTALDIEALDELGLRQSRVQWTDFLRSGVLALLGVTILYLYLARFQSSVLWRGQQMLLLVLLNIVFVLVIGLMVPSGPVVRYLAPASALAMLTTATLGRETGVAAAVFLGGVTGVIADNSLEMTMYAGLGGIIAALALGRVEQIGELFRAGLFVSLVHVSVFAVFNAPQDFTQPANVAASVFSGALNGGVSASLALGGLFLVGPLFDIVTTMRLIELSRPEHPLLQRLLREAPATYHHSLMVANLAEQAAESIGANALLTRVGAYYHDVGKLARPYFFTENQADGINPHDRLDPQTSAEVIISHVTDGIKLAKRYRLPSQIRAFIPEHHGDNRVSFLYQKAVELAGDPSLVDEEKFRYHGLKPQSRETALVMLADGCEAAVRSARPEDAEVVAKIVNNIIDQRVENDQFDECDLTLRDLAIVREVFVSALKGTFHPRIQYPSDDEQEEQEQPEEAVQTKQKVKAAQKGDGRDA